MNRDAVRDKVKESIEKLLERDRYLLVEDAHEISISHKLAAYLEPHFPGWDVDCEFNKYYGKTKELDGYDKDWVRPDIILHQRGTDLDLLVIEIKLTTSDDDVDCEKQKVRLYTEDAKLAYEHGLFLHLKAGGQAGIEEDIWF